MKQSRLGLLFIVALLVPACGGGGGPAPTPTVLSTTTAAFAAAEGGVNPADQIINLTGGSFLPMGTPWTAVSNQPWFTVTPPNGTLNPGQSINLNLHVNATFQLQAWVGATSLTSVPSARGAHAAAWTGTQMVVWGGTDSSAPNTQLPTGGRYTPDSWVGTVTPTGKPTERHAHSAVWTGTEMIIWGGWKFGTGFFNTGGRYVPDTWTASTTQSIGAPIARESHSAVWTGSRMIIWGGWDGGSAHQDGKLYNPVTDAWTGDVSTVSAPTARQGHVAVWTGGQMVVWGGCTAGTAATGVNTGGMYDPISDTWAATSMTGTPAGRTQPSAVWTGREVLVWGGLDTSGTGQNTGARYDPATNTWLGSLPTAGAPTGRRLHSAVWTGTQMVVWGGEDAGGSLNTGGIYQPPIPPQGSNTAVVTITPAVGNPLTLIVTLTVTP